jgi:hypothetical protein
VQPNDIYGTHLRLIFYDEAVFGRYQEQFDRIFSEPRYTDLAANLAHYSALYSAILDKSHMAETSDPHSTFYRRYFDTIAREKSKVDATLARLPGPAG